VFFVPLNEIVLYCTNDSAKNKTDK